MTFKTPRITIFCLIALLLAILTNGLLAAPQIKATSTWNVRSEHAAFLGSDLSPEQQLVFTTAVAASKYPGVALLDSPKHSKYTKEFLTTFRAEPIVSVGSFPEDIAEQEKRLDVKMARSMQWKRGPPWTLWEVLFPNAKNVVVCAPEPRSRLLHAACLAGTLEAPLFVMRETDTDREELEQFLNHWKSPRIHAVGLGPIPKRLIGKIDSVVRLDHEETIAANYLKHQLKKGSIQTLVVANPHDIKDGLGGMSSLAPWIALQKRAALLLTNANGDNTEELVRAAMRNRDLQQAESLILVAGLRAIPMQRRPNPIPADKDEFIEMEPLTPTGRESFSFATGRLFHDDIAIVPLMLARQRLLPPPGSPRKALIASNPGESLPLLETFSRNTALELRNAGYETTGLYGRNLTQDELRRQLPEFDLFLWEGHHSTLIKEWNLPEWTEPLPPSFIFLQSCLALTDWKAQPLLTRGAFAVIGSSTRTYSGSGGACSLAFFDALLYDQQTLGGGLRQAKNFLQVYSLLKEKRLGKDAQRTGANLRASWAFTLWGDPTLRLPAPKPPEGALPGVRHEVRGTTLTITLPEKTYPKVSTSKYQVQMRPNARLAGLLHTNGDEDGKPLVPLVFAEVHLPRAPAGQQPQLQSKLPSANWVWSWDERRRCGYLLALPRTSDREELRFRIQWAE